MEYTLLKRCPKCDETKELALFYKSNRSKDGHLWICIDCHKEYYKNSKEVMIAYQREYKKKNEENINKKRKIYFKNNPWMRAFGDAKNRCNNKNNSRYHQYGHRDIKFLLSKEEIKEIWFRDKAYEMEWPSIDRIDNDGHYEFSNCQFIEFRENSAKDKSKPILQYDLDGNFIKEWDSITVTEKYVSNNNISKGKLSAVANGKRKSAFGFIWKYKENNL